MVFFCSVVVYDIVLWPTQVEKRIHQHFAAARSYGKKKEFFALSVKEVDCFYARLAQELAGRDPNTYQPKTNHKRKAEEQSNLLKAMLLEQAAQRAMLQRLLADKK